MNDSRLFRPTRLTAVAAALFASASCFAGGGEALDIELPSMRSPIMAAPIQQNQPAGVALATSSAYASASFDGSLTREQVREQLKQARRSGTLSMHGDAGDTAQVLAARERFNDQQGEAIMAEYIADQQRTVALAEAERRRSEIENEFLLAETLSLDVGEAFIAPTGGAAAAETEVQIDVIDMNTSSSSRQPELVVISIDGGDAIAQRDRAIAVRRQLGAMGITPRQIYVESKDA